MSFKRFQRLDDPLYEDPEYASRPQFQSEWYSSGTDEAEKRELEISDDYEAKMREELEEKMDIDQETKMNETLTKSEFFDANLPLLELICGDSEEHAAKRDRILSAALGVKGVKSDEEIDESFSEIAENFGGVWATCLRSTIKEAHENPHFRNAIKDQLSSAEVIARIADEIAKNEREKNFVSLLDVGETVTNEVLGQYVAETFRAPESSPEDKPEELVRIPRPTATHSEVVNGIIIIGVRTEDFESSEVFVYDRGVTFVDLLNGGLFSHETNNKGVVPLARFRSDVRGWKLARQLAETI